MSLGGSLGGLAVGVGLGRLVGDGGLGGHVDDVDLGVGDGLDALGQGQVRDADGGSGLDAGDVDLDGLGDRDRRGGDDDVGQLDDVDRAGRGVADDGHGDLDLDALVAVHQEEVDVLHTGADGVALDLLGQGEKALAVDVEFDERVVVVAQGEAGVVLVEEDVPRVGAVAVDDGGDLAGAAGPARGPLAEDGTGGALEGDGVVGHEALLSLAGRRPAAVVVGAEPRDLVARRGATTRSTVRHHHVDHGCARSARPSPGQRRREYGMSVRFR